MATRSNLESLAVGCPVVQPAGGKKNNWLEKQTANSSDKNANESLITGEKLRLYVLRIRQL